MCIIYWNKYFPWFRISNNRLSVFRKKENLIIRILHYLSFIKLKILYNLQIQVLKKGWLNTAVIALKLHK